MSSQQATANSLQECKDILTNVSVGLEEPSKKSITELQATFVGGGGDGMIRTNVFKDVSAVQNAHQVIVSPATLISATRVTGGIEGRQWLGQMSHGALQRLSYAGGSGGAAQ